MSSVLSLIVTRNSSTKNHGTLTFIPCSTTSGSVFAVTGSHGHEPLTRGNPDTWTYTISGTTITVNLGNSNLVLSGNNNPNITYSQMTGPVTVDGSGNVTSVINGTLTTSTLHGPRDTDSWSAEADPEGKHRH